MIRNLNRKVQSILKIVQKLVC